MRGARAVVDHPPIPSHLHGDGHDVVPRVGTGQVAEVAHARLGCAR
jgi:hypothetical protein